MRCAWFRPASRAEPGEAALAINARGGSASLDPPSHRLSLRATVTEARRARRQASLRVLRWRWQLLNQHGVEVLDMESSALFDLVES